MTTELQLYKHRLLELNGKTVLAYDFAKNKGDGQPVAVTGPNAVECPRCKAAPTEPCRNAQRSTDTLHFPRVIAMNNKIKELADGGQE